MYNLSTYKGGYERIMIKLSEKLKMNDKVKDILEWGYCIIIAVTLALIVRYFVGTPTIVKQPSMWPTLQENQRLILNRLGRSGKKLPNRGDIVTFEAPAENYITPTKVNLDNPVAMYKDQSDMSWFKKFTYNILEIGKTSYIKRVIGLPGERVTIKNGYVYINEKVLDEPYLQEGVITSDLSGEFTDIVVPEGYVYVLGDNRGKSTDCRRFGCIPLEKIEGTVVLRFWPFNAFGKVE